MQPNSKLLLVDDEQGILDIIKILLQHHISEIHMANNGSEALTLIEQHDFDAIISDINMPVMNGIELLEKIRSKGLETPFIFVTGYGDLEKAREALRLGATDLLDKPFNPNILIDVANKAVRLGQTMKAVDEMVEVVYRNENIDPELKTKLQRMKKSIMMMRLEFHIFTKN